MAFEAIERSQGTVVDRPDLSPDMSQPVALWVGLVLRWKARHPRKGSVEKHEPFAGDGFADETGSAVTQQAMVPA
jgi:hypothetical protein